MNPRRLSIISISVTLWLGGAGLAAQTAAPSAVSQELHFSSVVSGGAHNCGLTTDGKAYCWGRNTSGQLGDSSTTDRAAPTPVAGNIVFRQITAGANHTCGVSTEDEPFCWGANQKGQLGNGGRVNATIPTPVGGRLQVTQITAGREHTCATRKHWDKQDRALCWGSNQFGQLGDMERDDSSLPVETFGVILYVSISAGDMHTCGATQQGKFFCWGGNERGQLGNGSITFSRVPFFGRMNRKVSFVQIVSGAAHSCGLTSEGQVYCWGENTAGQVGNGKGGRALFPTLVKEAAGYTALTAGGATTCGLKGDGSAFCWGSNTDGQYGADGPGSRTPAPALQGASWLGLSLGPTHGCGIKTDGLASCWGKTQP